MNQIRRWIRDEQAKGRDEPSEDDIVLKFDVSLQTARQAIDQVDKEDRKRRRGSW